MKNAPLTESDFHWLEIRDDYRTLAELTETEDDEAIELKDELAAEVKRKEALDDAQEAASPTTAVAFTV